MINLILMFIFICAIIFYVVLMFYKIKKNKYNNDIHSLPLITEKYVASINCDNKKNILDKCYNIYHNTISIYLAYIAAFFAVFTLIAWFYHTILTGEKTNKDWVYVIAAVSLTILLFIYINMLNIFVQLANSKRMIDLIEADIKKPLYKIIESGYYTLAGDNFNSLNILNIVILCLISFISSFGVIKSDPNTFYIKIIWFLITIPIAISILFMYKKIFIRIKENKTQDSKN